VGVKLNVLAGMRAVKPSITLTRLKRAYPSMVGRADPDVLKSQYFPTLRNVLLQKGGASDKVKQFEDSHLNALLSGIASATSQDKRMRAGQ
jgi:peptide/nickel transport system substrate-binding protein